MMDKTLKYTDALALRYAVVLGVTRAANAVVGQKLGRRPW
jgi:hypothetical protein